jgi:hypothetical protein
MEVVLTSGHVEEERSGKKNIKKEMVMGSSPTS